MTRTLVLLLLLILLAPASHLRAAGASGSDGKSPAADLMSIMLDLNTASYDELVSVRGIGPALASRILDYRTSRGSFSRIEELLELKGSVPRAFPFSGSTSLSPRLLPRRQQTVPHPPADPIPRKGAPTVPPSPSCIFVSFPLSVVQYFNLTIIISLVDN